VPFSPGGWWQISPLCSWELMKPITTRIGRAVTVGLVVLTAGGAAAWLAAGNAHSANPPADEKKDAKEADTHAKIHRVGVDDVVVPKVIQTSLALKTGTAVAPSRKRKLPAFQGRLNFDNNQFARVQSPLPGPVIELAEVPEPVLSAMPSATPTPIPRPLKMMDKVNKGDLLAVVWSKDLGEKKSEFVDALSRLKTDEETLRSLESAAQSGAVPERTVRDAAQAVKSDRVAVERAEATLLSWRVPKEDIALLREYSERLATPDAKRTDPAKWARVEIKAPIGGTILEKNVAVGQLVDPTVDLFRIGDLTSLAVWVHVFEEDLTLLRDLKLPTTWTVTAAAVPGVTFHGRMETIGPSIDQSQHTALVTGTVQNSGNQLRAGMAVSVNVELDVPTGEVEVPAGAVAEDGRESFIFVQTDASGERFTRKPVTVVRRSREVISIAERPGCIKPGDTVVTAGSLLLGDAFNDLPQPK